MTATAKLAKPYRHTAPIPAWWKKLQDEVDRGETPPPAFYVLVQSALNPAEHTAVFSDGSMAPATRQQLQRAGQDHDDANVGP